MGEGLFSYRAEIQDLLLAKEIDSYLVSRKLVEVAVRTARERGLKEIGISIFDASQREVLEKLVFKCFSRSIIMGWAINTRLILYLNAKANKDVKIRKVQVGEGGLYAMYY